MARKYLFVCDACGAAEQADSERLPDGWAIVVAAGPDATSSFKRTRHLDVCSKACALDMFSEAPELSAVDATPRDRLATTQVPALAAVGGEG